MARSNLGVVNTGEVAVEVDCRFLDPAGHELATTTYRLAPGAAVQDNAVLHRLTGGDVAAASAVLSTATAGGGFLAYVSVVDEVSNDPTFVPAMAVP